MPGKPKLDQTVARSPDRCQFSHQTGHGTDMMLMAREGLGRGNGAMTVIDRFLRRAIFQPRADRLRACRRFAAFRTLRPLQHEMSRRHQREWIERYNLSVK